MTVGKLHNAVNAVPLCVLPFIKYKVAEAILKFFSKCLFNMSVSRVKLNNMVRSSPETFVHLCRRAFLCNCDSHFHFIFF